MFLHSRLAPDTRHNARTSALGTLAFRTGLTCQAQDKNHLQETSSSDSEKQKDTEEFTGDLPSE